MPNKHEELKVFISTRESVCEVCRENLGRQAWIFLNHKKGALCLSLPISTIWNFYLQEIWL